VGAIEGIETRQRPLSTIDLFDRDFVLLVRDDASCDTGGRGDTHVEGDRNRRWRDAVRVVSERSGIAVRYVDLGDPAEGLRIENGGRRNPFELEPGGAALVRPDGFVAWRTREAADDPARCLEEALTGIGLRPLQTAET
jgi:putative polyketide hydroxylase